MGGDDYIEENRDCLRCSICGRIRYRVHGVHWEVVHLAWPGRREVGNILVSRLHPVAVCLFCLIPASRGLVYIWDCGWFYIWCMERVRDRFMLFHFTCEYNENRRLTRYFFYRWLIYASATILGSTVSFYVSRTMLSGFVKRLMEHDKRFAALSLTLKYDGLKLLCMIRLCPLPYSICNGAVSTFPTVQPLMYGLATAIISPKLLVPAFIGSRIRLLSEKGEEMSAGSKAVNICSIILTVGIGIFTGWYIYQRFEPLKSFVVNILWTHANHFVLLFFRTLARAKELEAQERADIRDSLQADHAAHRPHRAFSEDPDVNKASTTLARDEEERIGFTDLDDDNVDLILGDDSDSDQPGPWKNSTRRSYHDEFTDNDSDGFAGEDEAYGLHTHVQN